MSNYYRSHPSEVIPQVRKTPSILHKSITTAILSTLTHLVVYPFDSFKVRKIAKNKIQDIAMFQRNKVVSLTPYLGFFKGYLSVLIGNLCFLTIGQQSFWLGIGVQGLLKTWVDLSKISSQMGNKTMQMDLALKIFPTATAFAVLRDSVSRGSYILLVEQLISRWDTWLNKDINRKYHIYFGSAIVATLLSHPFDVAFTKVASQREMRYSNLLGSLRTIVKQEGWGKLYSGMDYRLLYTLLSVIIMGNSYDRLMLDVLQAF